MLKGTLIRLCARKGAGISSQSGDRRYHRAGRFCNRRAFSATDDEGASRNAGGVSCYLVRGNREEYLLENIRHPQNWKAGSSTSGLLDYTFRNLTGQDLEFFEHLPTDGVLVGKINESGRLIPVFVPQEEITPDTCRSLSGTSSLSRRARRTPWEFRSASGAFAVPSGKSRCRNPARRAQPQAGAKRICRKNIPESRFLGLALDGVGGHAHFAILTLENSTWQIECFQIPYDLEGYLAEFDRAGLETHGSVLARSLKRTLTCGVNYFISP